MLNVVKICALFNNKPCLSKFLSLPLYHWIGNHKELINNHDWDFEKEAKNFIKQRVIKPQKCKCRKATFTRTVDADFNCLCGKCGHPI